MFAESMEKQFNIRVYGILINDANEVLLSDERRDGFEFTKFPGGGLEYGEGLLDGLAREFREECQLAIEIIRHVHTTEEFVRSAFNASQVIAVHYLVTSQYNPQGRFAHRRFDFRDDTGDIQVFRWVPLDELDATELTFDTDKSAWTAFLAQREQES